MSPIPQSNDTNGRGLVAALVYVARQNGVHLSNEQIIRDFTNGPADLTQPMLVRAAESNGMRARHTKLNWGQLTRLNRALPAILRMKNGAVMVLVKYSLHGDVPTVWLRDPLVAEDTVVGVDELRLADAWDGDVFLIKRRFSIDDDDQPFGIMSLVAEVLKERRIFRDIGIIAICLTFFSLAPPMVYMVIVNRVLIYQRLSSLVVLAIGMAFVLIFDSIFGALKRYLVVLGTSKIDARLNVLIFDRLVALPMDYFERTPTGEVTHRLNGIWQVRNFLTGPLFNTALDTLTLIVLVPVLLILSPLLTLIAFSLGAVMFFVVLIYMGPIGRAYADVIRAEVAKNTFLVETIHGIRTIKSLAIEEPKRQIWDARVAASVRAHTSLQYLANQPLTILQMMEKLIGALVLLVGAYLAMGEHPTMYAGTLLAFVMIVGRAVSPLVQIASLMQQVQEVNGQLGLVAQVINQEPEQSKAFQGSHPDVRGAIRFSKVRFKYPGANTYALKDLSFDLPKGGTLGIMGRSGSGKTTVTRLLQGLSRNYEGLIKIDGIDLRDFDIHHLRSNIGVVMQDNFLFQGSIRENIMAGHRSASLEQITRAARLAGAEEFIERLPKGYETFLAEGSSNISGGQRQRLAIARALLGEPPILILDEATSALDPESESIVNANLERIAEGRSMIIVSHRLGSLVKCDQIMVLEQGELIDIGPHEDLLVRCEIYSHLWNEQNRHVLTGAARDSQTRLRPAAL